MVRRLLRLTLLGGLAAWILDRWLGQQPGAGDPDPIQTTILVDAPIDAVWTVLADIERQPEWMHDLSEVRIETPGPVGVGTRATGRVQALGLAIEDPVEITAFEAPTRFSLRHLGLIGGRGDIRLAAGPDGFTVVTWEEILIPPILPNLGRLAIALVFRPIFQRDLERLAGLVEAG